VSGAPKRLFDVVTGTLLLTAMLPVLIVAVVAILVVDGRPVLFRQDREGLGGRPFTLWKLRTMRRDAAAALEELLARDPAARAEYESYFRLATDPRLLPRIGRILRKYSVDELPQLWNVVRGDMSLVGPRPLAPDFIARLDPAFLERRRRVRPGITGLWQVSGRSDLDFSGLQALDERYLAQASWRLDLEILRSTPGVVMRGDGAY
jgi:lipopolysaccharide/colanic/teichoic acid biosynthesis glycosyltransferase